jgi:hypothetical protein
LIHWCIRRVPDILLGTLILVILPGYTVLVEMYGDYNAGVLWYDPTPMIATRAHVSRFFPVRIR